MSVKKKKKKKGLWIFLSIMLVISIVAGNRAAALNHSIQSAFNLMDRDESNVIASVEEELMASGTNIEKSDEIINILLVGADKRSTWTDSGRSDSCMIATIDKKHGKLKLTSIMRDMYVDIPGHGKNKFNAAYSYGGVELMYKTILNNFGLSVDGYAIVDFAAFRNVISTLGGVEINLTEEEHRILMNRYHRTSVLDLKPGMNKMNGVQALAYCRLRQDIRADFGRTERQRYVLSQIFHKLKTQPISKWYDTAEAVLPEVSTDLDNDTIMGYMKDVIFMGTTEINQFRIPVDGSYVPITVNGMDVLDIDLDENRKSIKEFIYEKEPKKSQEPQE